MNVFILDARFTYDYETDSYQTRVFAKKSDAAKALKEMRDEWHRKWVKGRGWVVESDTPTYFNAGEDGFFAQDSCEVSITEVEVE